ncbi:MAG TPA: DUF2231 domain-containing protein [Pusillimonas sp.]|uniref:DUF2231 domain-containing protein n=1 Tax=Pusillimonas sp. TaxID=3040095 RepID=UPI002B923161|nr:DUF2231 domain-containing protein [Pusillimonas sp.]HUH87532.1 DUF2231 domain-containing protein [Pusillimonas sp.]
MMRFRLRKPEKKQSQTAVALGSHPIHPMVVPFPIAFLISALACDAAFLFTFDAFWARLSLWLLGAGTFMGIVAGLIGAAELLIIRSIRRRAAAWSHFVVAVMLLSVAFLNWFMRLPDPVAAIYPWGLSLSTLGLLLVSVAGWLGGKLVFEERVGVKEA